MAHQQRPCYACGSTDPYVCFFGCPTRYPPPEPPQAGPSTPSRPTGSIPPHAYHHPQHYSLGGLPQTPQGPFVHASHSSHGAPAVSQVATPPAVQVTPGLSQNQLTQILAALQDATGSVLNANGKRGNRRQPGSAPAAKKPRARRNQPAAPPVPVNPTAPATDTITGPSLATTAGNQPTILRTPQPLQHFESVTRRLHDSCDSATNASDVWYNLYYLKDGDELAARPDNQARRRTNPVGDRKGQVKYTRVACRFCPSWKIWKLANGMTSTYRQHFEKHHFKEWREVVVENELKGWETLALKTGPGLTTLTAVHKGTGELLEPFTLKGLARKIAHWVAAEDQAVSAVESPFFRDIIMYASQSPEPLDDDDIPHRTYIHDLIIEEYDGEFEDLRKELENALGRISFTSDLWSCQILDGYMAITLHYCARDDTSKRVVLRSRLGAFRHVLGAHTGENLAAHFITVIEELGVLHKLGCITLDNASNCNTMMEHLERLLREKGVPFHRDGNRIRCFPHIVNIAVKHGLTALTDVEDVSDVQNPLVSGRLTATSVPQPPAGVTSESASTSGLPEVTLSLVDRIVEADLNDALYVDEDAEVYAEALKGDPIKKVRTLVTACRASTQRRSALRAAIVEVNRARENTSEKPLRQVELIKDVDTRWSATFLMVDRLIELYPAVIHFMNQPKQADIKDLLLTDTDIDVLKEIQQFLHIPHRVQELLSAEQTPTISVVIPAYEALLDLVKLAGRRWPKLAHAIKATSDALEQYMGYTRTTRVYALAVLTNPGFKKRWMEDHWTPAQTAEAEEWLVEAMLGYQKASRAASQSAATAAPAENSQTSTSTSQSLSRTPSSTSLLIDSIRGVTHPNAPAAAAQRQGFDLLEDIRRTILNGMPVGSDGLNSADLTAVPASPSSLPDETEEERQQRLDVEDLAAVKEELERYYAQGQLEQYKYNPLLYWEEFEKQFPLLFRVAVDILPVPASAVASERAFSSSKETDALRRTGLAPAIFEILQILKFCLKSRRRECRTGGYLAQEGELNIKDIALTPAQVRELFTSGHGDELKLLMREVVGSPDLA